MFTNIKSIGSLDLKNSFLASLILSNFSVFSLILILSKNKTHLFCNAFFCTESVADIFFFDTL